VVDKRTYIHGGVPFHGFLSLNPPPSFLAGEAVEILVDPSNPVSFFFRDLYDLPPSSPPAGATGVTGALAAPDREPSVPVVPDDVVPLGPAQTTRVDARVRRAMFARLAPVVDRTVAWLAKRERGARPASESSSATERVSPHPATRKVLTFDGSARSPVWVALFVLVYAGSNAVGTAVRLVLDPTARNFALAAVVWFITGAGLFACLVAAAARVRKLDRLFATCVVVPGHIVAGQHSYNRQGRADYLYMAIEYAHAGTVRRANVGLDPSAFGLVGATPLLLADPEGHGQVFIRDLYV
jgi:hypothetical protein